MAAEQAAHPGCEGIVSKRLGSTYRSGRVSDWVKIKNPAAARSGRRLSTDRSC
jgi:hypothetical protein